jgi:hypothetical protein
MRKLLLVSTILIYISFLSSAQQDTLPKSKTFKAWIKFVDGSEIKLKWGNEINGILYQINDSSLSISNLIEFTDHTQGFVVPINIDYTSIKVIKIRSGKSIGKGIVIGAATGLIFGGLVGYYAGQAYSEELTAPILGVGAFFGTAGGLIGGLLGSLKIIIPINGSMAKFSNNKGRLERYSYVH